MHLALEFATCAPGEPDAGRCPLWLQNGPVACELDLWAPAGRVDSGRTLAGALVRALAPLLAADETGTPFVPTLEDGERPWQIGLRLDRVLVVEADKPSARVLQAPGEPVRSGDPAYRIRLVGEHDAVTLRSDRAGIEMLAAACRRAERARRTGRD